MVEQIINGDNPDEMYWIQDDEDGGLAWSPGRVVEVRDKTYVLQCIVSGDHFEIEKDDPAVVHPTCLDGVSDLLQLGDFNEGALLHTIRERHSQQLIYTSIGSPILISVNPFQRLDIFNTTMAQKYRKFAQAQRAGGAVEKPEPHLFMVAEDSYQDLMLDGTNQSIIITGESGAGKTEATKIVLAYLARAGKGFNGPEEDLLYKKPSQAEAARQGNAADMTIEKQVLDSNPLMEAFGNAKTFKNNNSSRFGKFIQVNFNPTGMLHSASIVNYLLEKSRICFQFGVERNFHIFYQVIQSSKVPRAEQGPLTRKFLSKYRLQELDDYHYVNQSEVSTIDGVDDVAEFELTLQCMRNVHFSDQEIVQILDTVVAILNMGNVEFGNLDENGDKVGPSADSREYITNAARLLGVDLTKLILALTTKRQIIGKETLDSPLNIDQVYQARDSLCKHIYGSIFSWIVQKINSSISVRNSASAPAEESKQMSAKKNKPSKLTFIGLLDIFGFEIFAKNSFEQLCINYANEKLQQQFNQHMFTLEQEEYKAEGIEWQSIAFKDNQHTISMIEEARAPSIFKLLDEQFMLQARGTDKNLLQAIHTQLSFMKSLKKPEKIGAPQFIVVHYAGQVTYDIEGFVEKNKDAVSNLITENLASSKHSIINSIYKPIFTEYSSAKASSLKGNSLSNQFRQQLASLIVTLRKSSPRYIRCIKPNNKFTPTDFHSNDVLKQLRCAGMLEAIRIRKAGYSVRIIFKDFIRRYRSCLKGEAASYENRPRDAAAAILDNLKKAQPQFADKFQVGFTKVFLKEETRSGLEQLLNASCLEQVITIQAAMRGSLTRRYTKKLIQAQQTVCKRVYRRVLRQRLMNYLQQAWQKMKASIVRIQRARRRLKLHRKIMHAVNRKIAFEKQERIRPPSPINHHLRDFRQISYPIDHERFRKAMEMENRNQCAYESRDPEEVKQNLSCTVEMKPQNVVNTRLNLSPLRNQQRNESPTGRRELVHGIRQLHQIGSHRAVLEGSLLNINPTNMTGIMSTGENSEDLMTTIDGDQSSFYTVKRFQNVQLEQKEDLIEQLKAQIELLESERDNKWKRQIEELEEDKTDLAAKNKKWISKYEEEIEKNKAKFTDLHKQIKQLQEDNIKLEVAAKCDTTLQIAQEELEMVKDQLQDKLELIEHLESHQASLTEQHMQQTAETQALNDQLKVKIADLETANRDRTQELEQTVKQLLGKDEQIMQLTMELELKANNELSMDHERSFEQKNYKRGVEKAQLAEKKAQEEIQWLKDQLAEQKAKTKAANEENDRLQDQLLELKSNYGQTPESNESEQKMSRMHEIERQKMQQAIDELGARCRSYREEKKKLDAENNFFHMSTSIFIKLKPIMETEKQLCYQLAEVNLKQNDPEFASKKEKIEQSIHKCRETIGVIEEKLQRVLKRVTKTTQRKRVHTSRKTKVAGGPKENSNATAVNQSTISVSLLDLTNMTDMSCLPQQQDSANQSQSDSSKTNSNSNKSAAATAHEQGWQAIKKVVSGGMQPASAAESQASESLAAEKNLN